MSNMIPFESNVVPAHIRDAGQSDLTKSLMGSRNSGKRISIRGKSFRCIVGGEEVSKLPMGKPLDVICVNLAKSVNRVYYEGAYDPKETISPVCWSSNSKEPDESVESPQSVNCMSCPQNIAGSGQGMSRACRFKRRVAVVLSEDISSGVYMLELPATSLFAKGDAGNMGFDQYFKHISSLNHSIDRVVTRISFDEEAESPKLTFAPIGFPSLDMLGEAMVLGASPEALQAISLTVYKTSQGSQPKALSEPTTRAPAKREVAVVSKPDKADAIVAKMKAFGGVSDSKTDDE